MGLAEDVHTGTIQAIDPEWEISIALEIPAPDDVALAKGAAQVEAAVLYADLADSTTLINQYGPIIAGRVYKGFLAGATRIIREFGGEIRSFDGDRVMALYTGNQKHTNALTCALKINFFVQNVLAPILKASRPSTSSFNLAHCVGVDTGKILVVKTGIRSNNDLAWVGLAANVAAKLSTIRQDAYYSFATAAAHNAALESARLSVNGEWIWEECTWAELPGVQLYRSHWIWSL